MNTKAKVMKTCYYMPGVFAAFRVAITLWFLISNPMDLPLRFMELIPLTFYIVYSFTYFRLYSDGVPVISIVAPVLLHAALIFAFKRVLVIAPFSVLLLLDVAYLIVKSVKANLYPFDIEGDDDDDLSKFEEDEEG